MTDSLRNKSGIKSVEKSFSEKISSLTVVHSRSMDLSDWFEDKFGIKLKLLNSAKGKINLAVKKS